MGIFKVVLAFCVVCTLLFAGVADAAMSCCMTHGEASSPAAMQMDDAMLPCHNAVQNNTPTSAKASSDAFVACDSCGCQHCMKMTTLPPQDASQIMVVSGVYLFTAQPVQAYQPEGVFPPPKFRS